MSTFNVCAILTNYIVLKYNYNLYVIIVNNYLRPTTGSLSTLGIELIWTIFWNWSCGNFTAIFDITN